MELGATIARFFGTLLDHAKQQSGSQPETLAPHGGKGTGREHPLRFDQMRTPQEAWPASERSAQDQVPGAIHTGVVAFVGPKHVSINAAGFRAVAFLGDLSFDFINEAADVVAVEDEVEFVLLKPSDKNPETWQVSLCAVDEARARSAVEQLDVGSLLTGRVVDIQDREVELLCGGVRTLVPLSELSWGRFRHPTDVVQLHQTYTVKVLERRLPSPWPISKPRRFAHAIASLRQSNPLPDSPLVEVPFHAMPFRVQLVPRKPKEGDAIVLHVLEEMNRGMSMSEIAMVTGFPSTVLTAIVSVLESQGLTQNGTLTMRGRQLAEAIAACRTSNAEPIRGAFVSAALSDARIQRLPEESPVRDYPRSWPRPSYDRKSETAFFGNFDRPLQLSALEGIASKQDLAALARLLEAGNVSMTLRRDTETPWRAIWLQVPEFWVLYGMWTAFELLGPPRFCPKEMPDYCRRFLLVKLKVEMEVGERSEVTSAYWDPWTQTCWRLRSPERIREHVRQGSEFPSLPTAQTLSGANTVQGCFRVAAESWVSVEMK